MKKAELFHLIRYDHGEKQTLGKMIVLNEALEELYQCELLELPDRENAKSISRIPEGVYSLVKRKSKKYGWHFHVKNVPGRSMILIHFGNYYTNTRGCLLPGRSLSDLNHDGLKDVTHSKQTMEKLLELAPDKLTLKITSK